MRLETIGLKNFGSYRDAEIDLTNVAVAVVTGSNGSGKSTGVVDAPLAALFGKCRVSMDDMVSIGADDMTLTLTFALNGQRYRVIRKRSKKTKAGKSELALQIANGHEWEDISGARLPDTQEKICALLNADYELLTSTALLLQGSADRFSRATSSERKAILSQILRLDQYGLLKHAAGRHATIAETKLSEKQRTLTMVTMTAETLPSLVTRQEELAQGVAQADQARSSLEQHMEQLTKQQATLEATLAQHAIIPEQIKTLLAKHATLRTSRKNIEDRKARALKILDNRETIESKIAAVAGLLATVHSLELELGQVRGQAQQTQEELDTVSVRIQDGSALNTAFEKALRDLQDATQNYQRESERMAEDLDRDIQQGRLLQMVPCDATLQAQCRFTTTAVDVMQKVPGKQQALEARAITDEMFPEQRAALKRATDAYKAWNDTDWAQTQRDLQGRRQQLALTIQKVGQDIDSIKTAIQEAEKFTVLKPELDAADREVAQLDHDIARLADELASLAHDVEQLQAKGTEHADLQAEHVSVMAALGQDKIAMATMKRDTETAIGRLKEIELEIKAAAEAGRQAEALQAECAPLERDRGHFMTLSSAYTQIPILIMETAIPFLEEEANRILGKISVSGMRVRLDTQKALKSRDGLAETLDIVVRDVHGERPYEAFSGGERARIDLALRIGLSKLIANRAGSRIATLIIDEAFAAVDQEGVESLVECLPMLTDEFPLILVITHDENFKSAVAQRIVVSKGPTGSRIEVIP